MSTGALAVDQHHEETSSPQGNPTEPSGGTEMKAAEGIPVSGPTSLSERKQKLRKPKPGELSRIILYNADFTTKSNRGECKRLLEVLRSRGIMSTLKSVEVTFYRERRWHRKKNGDGIPFKPKPKTDAPKARGKSSTQKLLDIAGQNDVAAKAYRDVCAENLMLKKANDSLLKRTKALLKRVKTLEGKKKKIDDSLRGIVRKFTQNTI